MIDDMNSISSCLDYETYFFTCIILLTAIPKANTIHHVLSKNLLNCSLVITYYTLRAEWHSLLFKLNKL